MKHMIVCLLVFLLDVQAHAQLQAHSQKFSIEAEDTSVQEEQEEKEAGAEKIYTVVEEQASFHGSRDAIESYIETNLKCPGEAVEQGISGKVMVRFVVTQIGIIKDIEVTRSIKGCQACDDAAIEVIKHMPAWRPGKINGEAVNVIYQLPVMFRCE